MTPNDKARSAKQDVGKGANMATPVKLNLRQTIEGMTLVFQPDAARGLTATIQFNVSGPEPGVYHLRITGSECSFHSGPVDTPTLTISTPSDVWLKVSNGEIPGQEALMQGLYTANGDLNLLLKLDTLFKTSNQVSFEAPTDQRPAGPLALPGMTWMIVAFIPWIIHWVTFDIPGISRWISFGLPLVAALLIFGYRQVYNKPTWMDRGSAVYFVLASILIAIGIPSFQVWGSVASGLAMGGVWLSSLLFAPTPLSAEYSKWKFIKALWHNSMFIYPNAVISLMWGYQFIAASLFGAAAIAFPAQMLIFTIVRYLLLVPAFIFTAQFQKRATELRVNNYENTMSRIRFWAWVGLAIVLVLYVITAFIL